ncbi:hypothetical protein HAX54_008075, partial [Datura stramonium]|nr:hypothetical protein [Datura stramonium]
MKNYHSKNWQHQRATGLYPRTAAEPPYLYRRYTGDLRFDLAVHRLTISGMECDSSYACASMNVLCSGEGDFNGVFRWVCVKKGKKKRGKIEALKVRHLPMDHRLGTYCSGILGCTGDITTGMMVRVSGSTIRWSSALPA